MNEKKQRYLLKFRRYTTLETLEKVFDHLRDKVANDELDALLSASDHRRAEIIHGKFWDKVPASAWKNVT